MNITAILEIVKKEIKMVSFKSVTGSDSLLTSGLLNSITAVDLSVALEEQFNITIPLTDINEQHFETPEKIAHYIKLKTAIGNEI